MTHAKDHSNWNFIDLQSYPSVSNLFRPDHHISFLQLKFRSILVSYLFRDSRSYPSVRRDLSLKILRFEIVSISGRNLRLYVKSKRYFLDFFCVLISFADHRIENVSLVWSGKWFFIVHKHRDSLMQLIVRKCGHALSWYPSIFTVNFTLMLINKNWLSGSNL